MEVSMIVPTIPLDVLKERFKQKMSEQPKAIFGAPFKDYVPPSWDEWFMKIVYLVAEKSRDPSTKVGAVIVRDKHIISTGFNGHPIGVEDDDIRYEDRETKYKFVVHSEDNAILAASRFGISTIGSTMYTQGVPCRECAKSVIQSGVKELVIHKQWPDLTHAAWKESVEISRIMLDEAGVFVRQYDKLLGMKGYLNGVVYTF